MRSSGILVLVTGMLVLLLASCGSRPNYQLPDKPPPAQPPPMTQQSGVVTITPQYAAIAPGQSARFLAQSSLGGTLQWMVNNVAGGNSSVGLIDAKGNYTAPLSSSTANVVISAALVSSPASNFATAVVAVIQTGQLTPTPNPQVVAYSIYLPAPGNVCVQFGTQNLMTSPQATPSPNGGMVHVYVAGMLAHTSYDMHALVTLNNGASFTDGDRTFDTMNMHTSSPSTPGRQSGKHWFYSSTRDAYLIVADADGRVLWQAHGPPSDSTYSELETVVKNRVSKP